MRKQSYAFMDGETRVARRYNTQVGGWRCCVGHSKAMLRMPGTCLNVTSRR
jgi:hypothetical protein